MIKNTHIEEQTSSMCVFQPLKLKGKNMLVIMVPEKRFDELFESMVDRLKISKFEREKGPGLDPFESMHRRFIRELYKFKELVKSESS